MRISLLILMLHVFHINTSFCTEKKPHRVPKVSDNVNVDAVLDEDVWKNALVLEPNIEVRPGENIPAPVKTEVLLAYSETHLYIAFRAFDPDPSQIRAHFSDRDKLWSDDWVAVILDTFNDERRSIDFFCNPFGIQADAIESPQGEDVAWDAIWDSAGKIIPEGYIVEMSIPFSVFPFQRTEGDQIWGFDAVRSYPRDVRRHIGLFPRDRSNNCYLCQAEKLIGFTGATPGRDIEIDPTFSASTTHERENETAGPFKQKDRMLEPGITVRWGFRPNMTMSATGNPDFSQVETDAAQMDINTRFALSYPEKRPFFLEDIDIFRTRFDAVHTRMFAEPDWGIKLTGKEGRNTIGFIAVRDNITNLLFPGSQSSDNTSLSMQTTGSIIRYKRDVGKASSLGALITDRVGDGYFNRIGGIDGDFKFTKKDRIQLQVLGSQTDYHGKVVPDFDQPKGDFGGTACNILYSHRTRTLNWIVNYREVSPDFRADLGFMPQADFSYFEAGGGYTWQRDPGYWYNNIYFGSSYVIEKDHKGTVLGKSLGIMLTYSGPVQSDVSIGGTTGEEIYNDKRFYNNKFWFKSSLSPSGALEMGINGNLGEQIDYANTREGKQIRLMPWVEYRMGRHLSLELSHNLERLNVDMRHLYTAHISRMKVVYQFTRRTFLRTIVQYIDYDYNAALYIDEIDPEDKKMLSQILFSYKINPQTMLFLGYSDNFFGNQDIQLIQTARTFFMKIGYAWVL